MAETLDVVLTLIDKLTPGMRSVGTEVSQIQKQMATQALQNVAFAAGNVMAQTGAIVGDFVKVAGEAELVTAQLDAQLKAMGGGAAMARDEMISLGDEISKVTMFDDEAVVSAESVLLRFTSIGHDVFPEATRAAADLAQTMGTDMTSAAGMLGRALEDPISGMAALRRAKIVFTAAEEDSIKAMAKAGDVAGAQALMLQALEGRIGGAAEAAGKTFPGQVKIMENSIENFKEGVGGWLTDFFMALPKPIRDAGLAIGIIAPQFGGLAGTIVQFGLALMQLKAAGGIATLLSVATAATTATPALTGLATSEVAAAAGAVALTLPLALLAIAIGALVAVIVLNWDTLTTEMWQSFQLFKAIFERIIFEIQNFAGQVGVAMSQVGSNFMSGLSGSFAGSPALPAGGPGGKPIGAGAANVNVVYAPGMSLGNKAEFQSQFIPLIISAMRQVNRGQI